MAETLGTKDVLEQITARLNLVEQDIRALLAEMHNRSVELNTRFAAKDNFFEQGYHETGKVPIGIDSSFDQVYRRILRHFKWSYALLIATLLNLIGLWFK